MTQVTAPLYSVIIISFNSYIMNLRHKIWNVHQALRQERDSQFEDSQSEHFLPYHRDTRKVWNSVYDPFHIWRRYYPFMSISATFYPWHIPTFIPELTRNFVIFFSLLEENTEHDVPTAGLTKESIEKVNMMINDRR